MTISKTEGYKDWEFQYGANRDKLKQELIILGKENRRMRKQNESDSRNKAKRRTAVARARGEVAAVLRERGFTYAEIGSFFGGISVDRARQLHFRGLRRIEEWKKHDTARTAIQKELKRQNNS